MANDTDATLGLAGERGFCRSFLCCRAVWRSYPSLFLMNAIPAKVAAGVERGFAMVCPRRMGF